MCGVKDWLALIGAAGVFILWLWHMGRLLGIKRVRRLK